MKRQITKSRNDRQKEREEVGGEISRKKDKRLQSINDEGRERDERIEGRVNGEHIKKMEEECKRKPKGRLWSLVSKFTFIATGQIAMMSGPLEPFPLATPSG